MTDLLFEKAGKDHGDVCIDFELIRSLAPSVDGSCGFVTLMDDREIKLNMPYKDILAIYEGGMVKNIEENEGREKMDYFETLVKELSDRIENVTFEQYASVEWLIETNQINKKIQLALKEMVK